MKDEKIVLRWKYRKEIGRRGRREKKEEGRKKRREWVVLSFKSGEWISIWLFFLILIEVVIVLDIRIDFF